MKKKKSALIVAALMTIGAFAMFAGCGKGSDSGKEDPKPPVEEQAPPKEEQKPQEPQSSKLSKEAFAAALDASRKARNFTVTFGETFAAEDGVVFDKMNFIGKYDLGNGKLYFAEIFGSEKEESYVYVENGKIISKIAYDGQVAETETRGDYDPENENALTDVLFSVGWDMGKAAFDVPLVENFETAVYDENTMKYTFTEMKDAEGNPFTTFERITISFEDGFVKQIETKEVRTDDDRGTIVDETVIVYGNFGTTSFAIPS